MLSDENRKQIEAEIRKRILETESSIEKLEEQVKPVEPDRSLGRITRMDAIQQKNVAEANLRDAVENLHNLNQALENLGQDGFGICITCRQPIILERVLALPQVKKCVRCA